MSRYAHNPEMYEYSAPSSPRGRRYILKNLNAKKEREKKLALLKQKENREYLDLRTVPSSQGSTLSKRSGNNHIGTSNKVMPTDNVKNKGESPRKTPRAPPVKVSPRKELNTKNDNLKVDINKNTKQAPKDVNKKIEC